MTEELSRTSALADRHRALGSGLEDWNGMGTAWTYSTDPDDEHDAIITRCTHRQAESAAHRHARSLLPRIICLRREFHKSGAQARGRTAEQDALSLTCMHHNTTHHKT